MSQHRVTVCDRCETERTAAIGCTTAPEGWLTVITENPFLRIVDDPHAQANHRHFCSAECLAAFYGYNETVAAPKAARKHA